MFNNTKITLHYSVYMRTSGEKVRISDEAERVQSVSYSHIRSLPRLYTVVCLREGREVFALAPPLQLCKVPFFQRESNRKCNVLVGYFAFKGAPNSSFNVSLAFKGDPK